MPRSLPQQPVSGRPLVVTADAALLDDVLRLCAVAGVSPHVCAGPEAAAPAWEGSAFVLVDDALAADLRTWGLARRDDVILLGRDLDDATVWERAVLMGAEHVVFLPDAEAWLLERLSDTGEGPPSGTGPGAESGGGLAVLGARGGAGASTLACALAVTAARLGRTTALVDGDPLGAGLDLLLGGEECRGLRWPDLARARGDVDGGALSSALPMLHGATVLSWDRTPGDGTIRQDTARAVVRALKRRHEVLVVDVPRHHDATAQEALEQCGTALVVVPGEGRAIAAAARLAERVRPLVPDLRMVARGPSPAGLCPRQVAESLGMVLAGEVGTESGLAESVERGTPPGAKPKGALARFCRGYLTQAGLVGGRSAA